MRVCGLVAQLGERRVRNAEVESSILFESTRDYNPNPLIPMGEGFGFVLYLEDLV